MIFLYRGELLMKHKIILDTDPGIDDAVMISTALTDPQLDVALITTVAGNVTVDKTTKNALQTGRLFQQRRTCSSRGN